MKRAGILFALGEQALASGFTLLLFLVAVRLLDTKGLSIFSGLFSVNQSFLFFLFGLVLFPISSATGKNSQHQIGVSLFLMGVLVLGFILFSPLVMQGFAIFTGRLNGQIWLLAIAYFTSQCLYEAGRWLVIRLQGPGSAIIMTGLRFFAAFFLIACIPNTNGIRFIIAVIAANSIAGAGYLFILKHRLKGFKPIFPDQHALRHAAIFGTSVANFAINFATTALIDRSLGSGGLAAFQTLRSLTNPFGVIGQILDNHFSAHLARTGGRAPIKPHLMYGVFSIAAVLICVSFIVGSWAVSVLLAPELSQYWMMLPLLLLASLIHVLTRPIIINWRLMGDAKSLNCFSFFVFGGALPVIMALGFGGWPMLMIVVFAFVPVLAFGVTPLGKRIK